MCCCVQQSNSRCGKCCQVLATKTPKFQLHFVTGTPLRRTLVSSAKSECASCRQQWHVGSKSFLQQNPPVLNWECQLTKVDFIIAVKQLLLLLLLFLCLYSYIALLAVLSVVGLWEISTHADVYSGVHPGIECTEWWRRCCSALCQEVCCQRVVD